VLELRRRIGIPHTLAEIGVRAEHVAALAPVAVVDQSCGGNPLPVDATSLAELYHKAIAGTIRC
jgi:alcohol dehydrogenase class IV